jgi:hypothetical protein
MPLRRCKRQLLSFAALLLYLTAAQAQSPVTITLDPANAGPAIPADFSGLSFESSNLLPNRDGEHLFSAANQPLIELFRKLEIRSLRIGGGTADQPDYAVPGEKDIDHLFAFAQAANVKVLYTLRLPRANIPQDAAIAAYIQQHYASQLTCFEIGNEPDFYRRVFHEIQDYPTYRTYWKAIADAVIQAAPAAKFCGPAAGGTTAWSRSMAEDFAKSGLLAAIVQHEYTGGDGNLISDAAARDEMLSRAWIEKYDRLYESFGVTALANGLPYRLEETNNFTGGAKNATDTFAASLWALDYLHWWAAHRAGGVNFHNRRWILNTTIYPVTPSDDGLKSGYQLHPIAYGIQAFALASHGNIVPLTMVNQESVNLTAYAVRDGDDLFVTIINKKDPGAAPRDASITIPAEHAAVIYLSAPHNDVSAKEGITLDSAWKDVAPDKSGVITVKVSGASAIIIRMKYRHRVH